MSLSATRRHIAAVISAWQAPPGPRQGGEAAARAGVPTGLVQAPGSALGDPTSGEYRSGLVCSSFADVIRFVKLHAAEAGYDVAERAEVSESVIKKELSMRRIFVHEYYRGFSASAAGRILIERVGTKYVVQPDPDSFTKGFEQRLAASHQVPRALRSAHATFPVEHAMPGWATVDFWQLFGHLPAKDNHALQAHAAHEENYREVRVKTPNGHSFQLTVGLTVEPGRSRAERIHAGDRVFLALEPTERVLLTIGLAPRGTVALDAQELSLLELRDSLVQRVNRASQIVTR